MQQIKGKIRTPTVDGKPVPKMKAFNIRDAIFEAMLHRFSIDPTMVAFGEENRDWGGAFAVYRGFTEALPYHRLFNSPDLGSRHRGRGGRLRAGRRPRGGRVDVRRFHGPRRRRDLQPALQVAGHVGRAN